MTQLLIIGLDGATFDLIEPWANDLRNLAGLMRRGAWGRLRSTVPPVTFPAWTSFMTGVNPGQHGVFDFTRRVPGTYRVEFVNATHRRRPTLWRILSDAGLRVGVMGVPATYPPEYLNGFQISGFDAPVAVGIDRSFVHPSELYDEIRRAVGEYRTTDFQEVRIGPGWHRAATRSLLDVLAVKQDIAAYLLQREPWDCFMVLFGEADTVSHHFWLHHDSVSPRHPAGAGELRDAIRTVYRRLDEAVGALLALAPQAHVLIASDHGFGGAGDKAVYINRRLAECGLLRFRRRGAVDWGTHAAKRLALRLPAGAQERLFRLVGPAAGALESRNRFAGIDWAGTQAFSEEQNTCPGVWINRRDREPLGIVASDAYEATRDAVIEALHTWRDPVTGRPVVAQALRREAVYHGPFVGEAPDVVVEFALDAGYSYAVQGSGGRPGPAVRVLAPHEYLGAKGPGMNGTHRPDGVLLLAGPQVRAGTVLHSANIVDAAPTALHLLGLPVPSYMDGRVLVEALTVDRPVVDMEMSLPDAASPASYSPAEEAIVAARLRALGYLEGE
ncbi:MAG: alkaline phosphatase family protein [Chloroflexi bacterium]|nr:alkaline phosphatase family protein [Chloroflexota bacterium]